MLQEAANTHLFARAKPGRQSLTTAWVFLAMLRESTRQKALYLVEVI
ncbi:hypothetical protein CGLO_04175 [Colletotrichum gloeosporioides Cg-14]|uniref:Uncharacterized protein n=1 Tax=Colletotrichum gloeosporioides (strain Cg-14) TaxID=1237896 RepID=T0LVP7_COLGC|nr:hypothetical protein CGLO_04175 [Colletotrichum gloeosporioides Cg-14]